MPTNPSNSRIRATNDTNTIRNVDVVTLGPGPARRGRRRPSQRERRRRRRSAKQNNTSPVPELIPDLWTRILSFLDPYTLLQAQQVCKSWHEAISGAKCGVLWRDVLVREMELPKSKRLAYPKKAFEKLRSREGTADYRDYAIVSLMRTCPNCNKVLDICVGCRYGDCGRCGHLDHVEMRDVQKLSKRFGLPQWECEVCNPKFDDMYLDYYEVHDEFDEEFAPEFDYEDYLDPFFIDDLYEAEAYFDAEALDAEALDYEAFDDEPLEEEGLDE